MVTRTVEQRLTHRQVCRDVARLLRQAGGDRPDVWVTTQAWVAVGGRLVRPEVAVLVGEPPADGLVDAPPALVVDLDGDPARARRWLRAGVGEVWSVSDDAVHRRWAAPRPSEDAAAVAALGIPGVLDPVAVADLRACLRG